MIDSVASEHSETPKGERADPRIFAERVAHLRRQMPLVLGANMLVVPFVAYVLAGSLTWQGAVAWGVAIELLTIARWIAVRRLQASQHAPSWRVRREAAGFVIGSAASGLLWGLMGGATIEANRGLDPLLALMFICGMVSGAIGSLSTLPRVYAAFAIPAVLPVIALYMLRPGVGDVTYAFAAVIYLAVNLGYALSFSRTLTSSIALRFENADLIIRLQEARGRAEEESNQKSRFLQSASHDLRQPLHAVTLTLADLSEQLPEALRPTLNQGLSSVQSLAELLDRLLEASLASSGQLASVRAPVDLAALLANLEFETASEAAAKNLTITFRQTDRWVESDALILTQILRNYLSNALRHARGHILVAVRSRNGQARIEVWDDGPGIPPSLHKAIFEAFYQIGNRQRDPAKGRGLGLAIVEGMAKVLDAEIGLCSQPGRGSVFHVTLPYCAAPFREKDELPAAGDRAIQAPEREIEPHAPCVLVVEDDPQIRAVTAELLARWGFRTELAADGEVALAMTQAGLKPDAIISDLRLPGDMSGLDAITRIRDSLGRAIPALIVTGAADKVPKAALLGIALMKKPLLPGRLKAWLQSLSPGSATSD